MLAALGNALFKLSVATTGSLSSAVLDAVLSGGMCAVSSSVISASVMDVSTPEEVSARQAFNGIAGAAGFIIGPIAGGIINGKYGARAAYGAATAMASIQAAHAYLLLPETADRTTANRRPQKRTKDDGNGEEGTLVSPWSSAMKLFTGGRQLRWLSLSGAVQCALEPRAWSNVMLLYMRSSVGMKADTFGKFAASFAIASVFAKLWVKQSLKLFGPRNHTTISNLVAAVGFMVWGSSSKLWASIAALAIAPLHLERRRAVTSTANVLANGEGMGNGEFQAAFSNTRSVVIAATAMLLARIQGAFISVSRPGASLQAVGLLAVLAEVLHRQAPLPNK
jgi:hypothetical protein